MASAGAHRTPEVLTWELHNPDTPDASGILKKKNLMGMDLPSRKQHPEFSYTGKVLLLGAGTALKDLGKDLQA